MRGARGAHMSRVCCRHARSDLSCRRCGRSAAGSRRAVSRTAAQSAPRVLAACQSAAAMWVANAATVSPSADTATAASISRRRISLVISTARSKRKRPPACCAPSSPTRRISRYTSRSRRRRSSATKAPRITRDLPAPVAKPGVELFVYGRAAFGTSPQRSPAGFQPRQTRAKRARAIARRHGLDPARTVFAQQ